MPEQSSATPVAQQSADGTYQIAIREFTPSGQATSFMVPVPTSIDSQAVSVMLRAAILKKTTWKDKDFPTILHAVIYADRMGLDIMAGDVYSIDGGRMSTTAGAKIRHAMGKGIIEGYDIEMVEGPKIKLPYTEKNMDKVFETPELTATVTVDVKGWKRPVVYTAKLSEWFTGRNPNWRERPAYMLRKNALGKAMEEVAPMGVEADEAPPLDSPATTLVALNQAKALVEAPTQTETETKGEQK